MTDTITPAPETSSAPETPAAVSAEQKTGYKKKGKKKKKKVFTRARVYIQATYNNTIVSVADMKGDIVAWSSSGHIGFKGPKKSTPYAATQVVKSLLGKIEGSGLREVDIFVKGVGSGREAAIRAFSSQNVNVLTIKDMTPVPHNGCRPPRPRRV